MRIDELVEQLQKLREAHGNLEVRIFDVDECIDVSNPFVWTNWPVAASGTTDRDLADGDRYVVI